MVVETGDDGDGNITTKPVEPSYPENPPPIETPVVDDEPINNEPVNPPTPPPSGGPAD